MIGFLAIYVRLVFLHAITHRFLSPTIVWFIASGDARHLIDTRKMTCRTLSCTLLADNSPANSVAGTVNNLEFGSSEMTFQLCDNREKRNNNSMTIGGVGGCGNDRDRRSSIETSFSCR